MASPRLPGEDRTADTQAPAPALNLIEPRPSPSLPLPFRFRPFRPDRHGFSVERLLATLVEVVSEEDEYPAEIARAGMQL